MSAARFMRVFVFKTRGGQSYRRGRRDEKGEKRIAKTYAARRKATRYSLWYIIYPKRKIRTWLTTTLTTQHNETTITHTRTTIAFTFTHTRPVYHARSCVCIYVCVCVCVSHYSGAKVMIHTFPSRTKEITVQSMYNQCPSFFVFPPFIYSFVSYCTICAVLNTNAPRVRWEDIFTVPLSMN